MSQSHYVDGFVLAVPRSKLDDYKRMATLAGRSGWSTARSSTGKTSPKT